MGLTLPVPMHKVSLMAASFIVELKPTKNAAVSSGRGKLSLFRLLGYWLAQLFGALLGVLVRFWLPLPPLTISLLLKRFCLYKTKAYWVISYETFEVHPADWFNSGQALAAELFFSFLLINGVVQTVVTDTLACNPFFGLAIGFCITAGAIAVGQHRGMLS
ncbi:hypothetical protein QOT17_003767 [Balamuthia mandrillaris]